jgi:uncharacterized protein (DUF2267 family)
MSSAIPAIPVLTDIIEDGTSAPPAADRSREFLGDLERQLVAAVHEHADELVHNACREMEALLLEQVSDRLRAELPALVARILEQRFRGPNDPA